MAELHHFQKSPDCVSHMEKVLSIVRKIYGRKPTENLKDLDVNTAIWSIFMSVTLQAAVHLGRDYSLNLRSVKNQSSKSVDQFFRTTEKLIKEQTEITGLSTLNWDQPMWRESSLLRDRVVRIMTSKTYVFSDSVLCLGGISREPVQAWKDKIKWYLETCYLKELDRTDGEQIELEQTILPRFTTVGILNEIQNMMAEFLCEPEQFKGRIIVMSMFNDITWRTPGNEENGVANSMNVATYAKRFPFGCWSYLGPGCEKKWCGTHVNKPNGEWSRVAEIMIINFAESRHPSPFGKRRIERKRGGKKTIRYNRSQETVEFVSR